MTRVFLIAATLAIPAMSAPVATAGEVSVIGTPIFVGRDDFGKFPIHSDPRPVHDNRLSAPTGTGTTAMESVQNRTSAPSTGMDRGMDRAIALNTDQRIRMVRQLQEELQRRASN